MVGLDSSGIKAGHFFCGGRRAVAGRQHKYPSQVVHYELLLHLVERFYEH
jgi:hypothetical protein